MEAPLGPSFIRLFSPSLPSDPSERPTFSLPPSSIFPRESQSARHKTMLLFGGGEAMNGFVTRWESECLRTIRGIPLLGTWCIQWTR